MSAVTFKNMRTSALNDNCEHPGRSFECGEPISGVSMIPALRHLDSRNINDIAAIHMSAFPDSAWTKLGVRVVSEYYLWHLLGPHPIVRATGVYVDRQCAGFCVSGVFNSSTSGFLSKNRNLLARRLILKPWLILDPVFFEKLRSGAKLLRRFKARNRNESAKVSTKAVDSFGILAIAVDPRSQGLGIGQLLMDDAEKAAVEQAFSKMDLTVNPGNLGAIRFYEKLGWMKLSRNDIWKGTMVKNLTQSTKSSQLSDEAAPD